MTPFGITWLKHFLEMLARTFCKVKCFKGVIEKRKKRDTVRCLMGLVIGANPILSRLFSRRSS